MAGYVNSWIEQYQNPPVTCATVSNVPSPITNPWIWLLVGLVLGSLQFEKKHVTPKS